MINKIFEIVMRKKIIPTLLLLMSSAVLWAAPASTPIAVARVQAKFFPPPALHEPMLTQMPVKTQHIVKKKPTRVATSWVYDGSLKANITRLAKQAGWRRVLWNVPNDYHWVGTVKFATRSLPTVLKQVLQSYPLQATFYQGNHVLVITSRVLT